MGIFLFLLGSSAPAAWQDDVGATRLFAELGAARPTGTNITVGHVEGYAGGFFPKADDPEFVGKTFHIITPDGYYTNGSGHATIVGRNFYGNSMSLAPGVMEIDCYEAGDFMYQDFLTPGTYGNPRPEPLIGTRRVYNFSVAQSGASNLTQRMDYAIDRDGFFAVAAVLNDPWMNGFLASAYNIISVGVSDGDHSTGGTTSDGSGRMKPEIVVPGIAFTSFATPVVAGAAAMLLEVVDTHPALLNGGRPQTLKAILMAGATKSEFPTWDRLHGRPLDDLFGVGELNIYNSYHLLVSGEKKVSATNLVDAMGWDYQPLSSATNQWYFFEVPTGQWISELSALLTWHRKIVDGDPSAHFQPIPVLPDLDLRLYQATNFTPGILLDFSTSRIDNVEHIFAENLKPGQYAMEVIADSAADYALAWYSRPMSVPLSGPISLTANSDVHVQLTATPAPLAPVDGTGEATFPYIYHLGDESLLMNTYLIRSSLTNCSATFIVPSISYATGSGGGVFDFSGIDRRGHVQIISSADVSIRSITTESTAAAKSAGNGGNVTVRSIGPLTIDGPVTANATGSNNSAGTIEFVSETGSLQVTGPISAASASHAGAILVHGASVGINDVVATTTSTSRNGGDIALTSTAGAILAGDLLSYAGSTVGNLTLSATGGGITVQNIDARNFNVSGSSGVSGGTIDLASSGAISVGALDTSTSRTRVDANVDYGGAIEITAASDITVSGSIRTYVSSLPTHASLRSRGGSISITAMSGNIALQGAIDASSPAGTWNGREWRGSLTLSAGAGSITLASLDVDKVGLVSLTALPDSGTLIEGDLLGLESDIVDGTIDRFDSVRGPVYYDATVPSNAYLSGATYPMANSDGGPFYLTPLNETPVIDEPEIAAFTFIDAQARALFLSQSGVTYRLWYTTNLLIHPTHWMLSDTVLGDGNEAELMDDELQDSLRIYRIDAE